MKLFGNLPQERAMRSLIHDTNGKFSLFSMYIKELENLTGGDNLADNEIKELCNKFRVLNYRLQANIDDYYKKFEKDFE